ncbi:cytochrome P460 family protein [bacterium]|nr:cytochrome P460 family protein [bacterium]
MKRFVVIGSLATIMLIVAALSIISRSVVGDQEMPFGGKGDVEFANMLWKTMAGYEKWQMKSDVYPGTSPHGKFLRLYYNIVNVDKKPYHVIIKDNFGGEDATLEKVSKSPKKYLAAVTVMLQREAGYDSDNNDWFWVKYKADSTIDKNPMGMALAGRVAKGMDTGCIACHKNAKDNDYFFTNDKTDMSLTPEGLLQEKCTTCHDLDRVNKTRKNKSGWEKIIAKMIKNGAKLNKAEQQTLVDYLSQK